MNIQMFLKILGARLKELGVDETTIKKQLAMFERYLNSLDEGELANTLDDVEQIDVIAENICELIKKKARRVPQSESVGNFSPEEQTGLVLKSNAAQNPEMSAETAVTEQPADENPETKEESGVPEDTAKTREYDIVRPSNAVQPLVKPLVKPSESQQSSESGTDPNYDPLETEADESEDSAPTRTIDAVGREKVGRADIEVISTKQDPGDVSATPDGDNNEGEVPTVRFDEYDDFPENTPGSPMFWVLFIATLPISGALVLAVLLVFLAMFAALSVAIIALIGVLICDIAAGTALSLVGIIYGITCTMNVLSEGLFEIGFGVLIGGISLCSGILVYNLAVRLLPFVIKKLTVLMSYTMGKIKELFYYLKKESSRK